MYLFIVTIVFTEYKLNHSLKIVILTRSPKDPPRPNTHCQGAIIAIEYL